MSSSAQPEEEREGDGEAVGRRAEGGPLPEIHLGEVSLPGPQKEPGKKVGHNSCHAPVSLTSENSPSYLPLCRYTCLRSARSPPFLVYWQLKTTREWDCRVPQGLGRLGFAQSLEICSDLHDVGGGRAGSGQVGAAQAQYGSWQHQQFSPVPLLLALSWVMAQWSHSGFALRWARAAAVALALCTWWLQMCSSRYAAHPKLCCFLPKSCKQ